MIGMSVAKISAGTIRKPPPIPKNPASRPTQKAIAATRQIIIGVSAAIAVPPGSEHRHANNQHQDRKQKHQPISIDRLADRGADEGSGDAGRCESPGSRPAYVACPCMVHEVEEGVGRNRYGAGTDGDVGRHSDQME
jgi:hypothetical protein